MKIITNTAISLDGKISVELGKHLFLGSEEDRRRMSEIRALADAILVGGNSFRNFPVPMLPNMPCASRNYVKQPLWNVVVSRRGDVEFTEAFLAETRIRPLLFIPAEVNRNYAVETLRMEGGITPQKIIHHLAGYGVETLLIEAGGDLITQFLQEELIDEVYVTLCPKIIGGRSSPAFIAGEGFSEDRLPQLKLIESRVVADEIFLHYRVLKRM